MAGSRRLSIGAAALIVCTCQLSGPCAAQTEAPRESLGVLLERHKRGLVKLQYQGRKEEGKLLDVDDRSLTLETEPFVTESIDLHTITQVWVQGPLTPRDATTPMIIGGIVGAAVALFFVPALNGGFYCVGGCEAAVLKLALVGAGLGAMVGSFTNIGRHSWERAYPP